MTTNDANWYIQKGTSSQDDDWSVHPPFPTEDSLWPRKALDSFYMGNPTPNVNTDSSPTARDVQVAGKHYRVVSNMQPWDIIDAWNLNFYEGNVVKYVLRAKHKGSQLDDYKKAKHYIERLIEQHENNS